MVKTLVKKLTNIPINTSKFYVPTTNQCCKKYRNYC